MGWIILIVLIVIAYYMVKKSKEGSEAQTSNSVPNQLHSTRNRTLHWDNMYDVCYAMGCLTYCVGNMSYVYGRLDDNSDRISFSVNLDEMKINFTQSKNLQTSQDYKRLYVPDHIAEFLLAGPFKLVKDGASYRFKFQWRLAELNDTPENILRRVADAFESGVSAFPREIAEAFQQRYEIKTYARSVSIEVD